MLMKHGDAPRLLPGNTEAEAHGFTLTPETALASAFTGPGEFGKIFPDLAAFRPSDQSLQDLGAAMDDTDFAASPDNPNGDNANVPAGFTYLGQFVDHDITFDKTFGFPEISDPAAIEQARTPSLDLDSLYGMGPELQSELYAEGESPERAHFKIGATSATPSVGVNGISMPHDLPRQATNEALIGDPRNDENLIVAQTHLAFLQFHNKVLDDILNGTIACSPDSYGSAPTPFEQARQIVRWHYQWIVLHDFIRRVIQPAVLDDVLQNGRNFYLFENVGSGKPFMPLEHSVASYRLGHSMIRQSYDYNRVFSFGGLAPATLQLLFHFTGNIRSFTSDAGLPPGAPIPSNWILDWRKFFEVNATPAATPNPSRRLDTKLANPLRDLPEFRNTGNTPVSLAQRNLLRASRVGLPSGQDVAAAMSIGNPLSAAELASGITGAVVTQHGFEMSTPLWFYILKEAEVREAGERLGETGSRLLAEVFVGLLEGDELSFLADDRNWKPTLESSQPDHFTMADLLTYVGHINPIGEAPEDTGPPV